jgi:glyoxylase-like metal-dependent hydrolase (beta-lactamase superfamily II)
MTLLDGDCEVVPGVWMRRAPGHNRDMMAVTAQSGGATFCFLSDLVPSTAHLQPTWITAFDLDPLLAIENKIHWLSKAVKEDWICAFAHDSEIGFARIADHPKTRFAAVPL